MNELEKQIDWGNVVVQEVQPKIKKPNFFQVFLINDDFTPMDFVVSVVMNFFGLQKDGAIQVMLKVHNEGKGICGVYTRDIAETKVAQVNNYARNCDYPLLCDMEIA